MTGARAVKWFGGLGRLKQAILLGLAAYVVTRLAAAPSLFSQALGFVLYILVLIFLFRTARGAIAKAIWRLRNRLITAYLFIALVPVLLIVLLAGLTTYWITGQMAGYLVDAELNRRTAALVKPVESLARLKPEWRAGMVNGMMPFLVGLFPELELLIRDGQTALHYPPESTLAPPPPGWPDTHGLVLVDGRIWSWARAFHNGAEAIMASPLDRDYLSDLIPGLGDVSLLTREEVEARPGSRPSFAAEKKSPKESRVRRHRDRTPPPLYAADIVVTGYYPIPIQIWAKPGRTENGVLFVETRTSAVLGLVCGHNPINEMFEWGQFIWSAFLTISGLFLVVELVSLVIGVSLTRTITSAVDELYQGTQRVMEGDFSHRIPVRGKDQLAALGVSFNTMTANLERLIVVAKEKERLQSELEIAREVQNQLFPKNVPDMRTLEVTGLCNPARMVSGDYYDFMSLPDATLAFAIGDVAGKGISAALLMAAIQSTMRTQLNAGAHAAAAAANGRSRMQISTARLVSTLNKQLYANTSPEKYATFFFGLYDDESGSLLYTNAGHLQPILIRCGTPQLLEVTGTVVGAFPFALYEEKSVQLGGSDLLVAYTDGIVEPENEYGEMFGDERLTDLLVKHASTDGAEVIARVMEAVRQWTGEGELQDDMTMLVARRI